MFVGSQPADAKSGKEMTRDDLFEFTIWGLGLKRVLSPDHGHVKRFTHPRRTRVR